MNELKRVKKHLVACQVIRQHQEEELVTPTTHNILYISMPYANHMKSAVTKSLHYADKISLTLSKILTKDGRSGNLWWDWMCHEVLDIYGQCRLSVKQIIVMIGIKSSTMFVYHKV